MSYIKEVGIAIAGKVIEGVASEIFEEDDAKPQFDNPFDEFASNHGIPNSLCDNQDMPEASKAKVEHSEQQRSDTKS